MKHIFLLLLLGYTLQSCSQSNTTKAPSNTTTQPTTTQPTTTQPPVTTQQPVEEVYKSPKEGWLVDMEEAYAISSKEGKPILANFTGSDWCGWCKKLDADVFSKPEFQTWAKKNVVLLELDFPRRKQIPQKYREQNAALQNAMRITGYPTIYLLDMQKDAATGKMNINALGRAGYTASSADFIKTIEGFMKKG